MNLGIALFERGETDAAIAAFRQAIRLKPDEAAAHQNLGTSLARKGRHAEAAAAYREGLKLQPNSGNALNSLAWFLATCDDPKLRNPKEAVALAKRATEIEPKDGGSWNTLGVARYRIGDWKAASAALEKAVALRKGGDSFDGFFLAMAHWQLGEKETARKSYDHSVQWMEKYQRSVTKGYILDANRLGWRWKVRALVNGEWTPWSEERVFNVAPLSAQSEKDAK